MLALRYVQSTLRVPNADSMSDLIREHIEQHLKVRNKRGKIVRFRFNPIQEKYWPQRGTRDIILKARQQGFSTLILGWFLSECLVYENIRAVIVSHDKDSTEKLLSRARFFLKKLKEDSERLGELPPTVGYETKEHITFPETNSEIYIGTAGSKSFGRGDTISHLHCSEVAFWENPSEIMTGLLQAVPYEGHVIIETTANGIGNYFHRLWLRAMEKRTVFVPHFFPWHENPEYQLPLNPGEVLETSPEENLLIRQFGLTEPQLKWRRWKMSEMIDDKDEDDYKDPEIFKQEYPMTDTEAFLSSGRPFFVMTNLHEMNNNIILAEPPLRGEVNQMNGFELDSNGRLLVWKKPAMGMHYSIGGDVAEGVAEGDFSTAYVICNETGEHVATWHGSIDPDEFGSILYRLGRLYNQAFIGCEVNNHGFTTNLKLKNLGYPFLYSRYEFDERFRRKTKKVGWRTDSKTRPMMLDDLARLVRDRELLTFDSRFLKECMAFKRNDRGKPEAEKGSHDDRVIAMAIANQMAQIHHYEEDEEDDVPENEPLDALAGY